MQMLVEIVKNLWGKPWFSEALIILFFISVFLVDKIKTSERYLRWKVKNKPNDFEAHMNLGGYLLGIEDCLEEAEEEFKKAFSLNPQDKGPSYQLFLVQVNLKKNDLAEVTLARLLKDFPDDVDVNICAGNFYSETSENLSEEYYKKAVSIASDYYFGLQNYGMFLDRLKRYSEAEGFWKRALSANPWSKFISKKLIINLMQQEKYSEVEINARKFLKNAPADNDIRWFLGVSLHSQDKTKEAIKVFEEILKRDSKYVAACNNLGTIYFFAKDYTSAEKYFRQAIEIDSSDAWYYFALAEVLAALKRYDESIQFYKIALSIEPDDISTIMSLACIYRCLSDQNNSIFYLEKARQIVKKDDWYNLACIESIGGNLNLSFENLRNALREDDFNFKWAWEDPDLQWIRDDPRFIEIVGPKPE